MVIHVIKIFLYSSVYSCHIFLISSVSVRFLLFLSFIVLYSLDSSNFLEEASSLPHFKKAFLSPLTILWNSAFSWIYLSLSFLHFLSILLPTIYKASSGKHCLLAFPFLWNGFGHCFHYNVTEFHP